MTDTGQKQAASDHLFDLLERNLPQQESDDKAETLSTFEFLLWILGIAFVFLLISIVFHLLS
jgi:hypothetical protein